MNIISPKIHSQAKQREGARRWVSNAFFVAAVFVCAFSTYMACVGTSSGPTILATADAALSSTNALKTDDSASITTELRPIETLQVGERVRADSPTGEFDNRFGEEVVSSDWRKLSLTAPKRDGSVSDVELIRPLWWLKEQQATVGQTIYIAVPECGIDGNAMVHSIDACPYIQDGPGRVITGTFRHLVPSGIELTIAGESQPIRCTGNHPIWSETRQEFVRADSLQEKETLRAITGLTQLVESRSLSSQTHVYNLEVHGLHVYHVGESGLLVHNSVTGLLPILNNCPDLPNAPKSVANGTADAFSGAQLKQHLTYAQKYGKDGFKQLENGRIRYSGKFKPADKVGDYAGARTVREWDPSTGAVRNWYESIDHAGNVRSIAPKPPTHPLNHHIFDEFGNYMGRR